MTELVGLLLRAAVFLLHHTLKNREMSIDDFMEGAELLEKLKAKGKYEGFLK